MNGKNFFIGRRTVLITALVFFFAAFSVSAADRTLGAPSSHGSDTGTGISFSDPLNPGNTEGDGGLDPLLLAQAEKIVIESTSGSSEGFCIVIKTDEIGWQQKDLAWPEDGSGRVVYNWYDDYHFDDVEHTFYLYVANWDSDHPITAENTTVRVLLPPGASGRAVPPVSLTVPPAGTGDPGRYTLEDLALRDEVYAHKYLLIRVDLGNTTEVKLVIQSAANWWNDPAPTALGSGFYYTAIEDFEEDHWALSEEELSTFKIVVYGVEPEDPSLRLLSIDLVDTLPTEAQIAAAISVPAPVETAAGVAGAGNAGTAGSSTGSNTGLILGIVIAAVAALIVFFVLRKTKKPAK